MTWKFSTFYGQKFIRLIVKIMAQLPLIKFLNQICAKVSMNESHIKLAVNSRWNGDDVTCFQAEKTGSVNGCSRGLSHGHRFAIHINIDPSISAVEVGVQVDIVPSSDWYNQFSIMVLHAAHKMAVRGTDRPVFDD